MAQTENASISWVKNKRWIVPCSCFANPALLCYVFSQNVAKNAFAEILAIIAVIQRVCSFIVCGKSVIFHFSPWRKPLRATGLTEWSREVSLFSFYLISRSRKRFWRSQGSMRRGVHFSCYVVKAVFRHVKVFSMQTEIIRKLSDIRFGTYLCPLFTLLWIVLWWKPDRKKGLETTTQ